MAGLVNALVQRQQQVGPSPTVSSQERPGNPGAQSQLGGAFNFPIFNQSGSSDTRPNGPAQDWTVTGPDGKPVPYNQWPNQSNTYTSPDEIARRQDSYAQAQNIINQYRQSLDSGLAGLNDSRAQMMLNQAARDRQFGAMQGAYNSQLQGQLAEANLDIQAADLQYNNMPLWQSFLAQQWGNTMTAGKADLDFIAEQQVNSANQRLIDWREIQQGRKEVDQQATRARRDATSAAVVGGVIQNAKQDYADIDQERGNALYGLDIQDERSRLSETQRRQELSNRRKQLIGDLTGFDISTREQQAKLREREQLLGIEAQKARLKPRQLMDAMNVSLQRLGLDKVMSTGQYLEAMANAGAQERALFDQFNRGSAEALMWR